MSPRKAACVLLQAIRSWRKKIPLRRWAITAMAKKLSQDCETQRLAKTIYKMFSDSSSTLRCDRLVEMLAEVQAENAAQISECASVTSKGSVRSWKVAGKKALNEIRNYSQWFTRLSMVPETPTPSPCADSPSSVSTNETTTEDLSDLVGALDGNKSGTVQYTLLVAALLPEHVYCDDLRIQEVFQIFDVSGKGRFRPHDLRMALNCPTGHAGRFSQMVHDCDRDGDGALDLSDFRAVVRGEVGDKTPSDKKPLQEKKPFTGKEIGGLTTKSGRIITL